MRTDRIKLKVSDEVVPLPQNEPKSSVTEKIVLIAPLVFIGIGGTLLCAASAMWLQSHHVNKALTALGVVSLTCAAISRCLQCLSVEMPVGEDLV